MERLCYAGKLWTGILFYFFCLLPAIWSSVTLADPPDFIIEADPPTGFEELLESQRSLVDIYYGNRYLTSQLATFTSEIITLSDPAMVVRLIDNINDPSLIEATLTGELETNSSDVCPTKGAENCGSLKPAVASVIFDDGRFRLDIFINRNFLRTQKADVRKYLPPSDAGSSLLQSLTGVWSGSDNSDDDYTISGLSQFANRENSIYLDWDYTKEQHLQVNDFYGRRSFEGVDYNVGLVGSGAFGLSFTSDRTLLGARVASSDNTREDLEFAGGTPLNLFLPTRGRVEIRRDDRLINSYVLEAGSQQLNTSSFPSGAYDIDIQILDEGGSLISQETRFFAKQFRLPPKGEWLYFAETGRIMSRTSDSALPDSTEQWLTRAGVSRRLTDSWASTVAAAVTEDDSMIELGMFNMGYIHEISPSVMLADSGAHGVNLAVWLRYGPISMNGNYRRLWKDDDPITGQSQAREEKHPPLMGDSFEQSNVSVHFPFAGGAINYHYSENKQGKTDTIYTNAIDYRVSLFQAPDYSIDMSVEFSRSGDTDIVMVSMEFRMKDDRMTWRARPRAEYYDANGNRDRTENLRLEANWDDLGLFDSTIRANVGAETSSDAERYDARFELGNSWGHGNIRLNHVDAKNSSSTSYGANFDTRFLTDGKQWAMGGENHANSALLVNVNGGKKGDTFDVNVDGQRLGYAVAGRPSIIALSPYRQYRVNLSSSASVLYSIDERERMITLYPGNVVSIDYEATELKLLFGRLLFDEKPTTGARISGGLYPAQSDDLGMFQLQSRADLDTINVKMKNGWICKIPVPTPKSGYVNRMGTIDLKSADCAPVSEGKTAISKNQAGDDDDDDDDGAEWW
ncbi:MAG: TcfC E-set like domain-containing protein [Endozoicomonadaceae bacterium]|nr:TcfC E-set like domain-containing protein [Endozoicomonadaceae bacterium]